MRRTLWILFAGAMCYCTSLLALAATIEFHGDVGTQQAYGVKIPEFVLSRLETNFSAKAQGENCSGKLAVRSRIEEHLTPGRTYDNELREAVLLCRNEDWLLSVGKQAVVWGKADGFRVLDAIHPFDYREFIFDARESSRIPLSMMLIEHSLDEQNFLQLLVIPERRHDILPGINSRFAAVWPQPELDSIAVDPRRSKESSLHDTQAGIKWEHAGQQLGYTVNVLNRWSPQPIYVASPTSAVTREYYRQWVIGGSFDLALSKWIVRGEAIYLPNTYLINQQPAPVPVYEKYKQVSWLIGLDRNVNEWLLSAQFFETRTLGGVSEPAIDRKQRFISLLANRSFLQDRLKISAFAARDITQKGTWLNLSLIHEPVSNLEISAGANLLAGTVSSVFGRIKDESYLEFGIKFSF